MDVIDDGFFDETPTTSEENPSAVNVTETGRPFPEEDYDGEGKLKRVRKRMLKKLVKCECRYLFPVLFGFIGLMFFFMLAFSLQFRFLLDDDDGGTWLFISAMLYIYSIGAVAVFAFSYPATRYSKNFFKNEGYLTFSIPASAEEHIFAKRIGALACLWIAILSILLSVILFFLFSGALGVLRAIFMSIGNLFALEPVHAILFSLELICSLIVGTFTVASAIGAGNCFMSQYSGRRRIGRMTAIVVFLVVVGEGLVTSLLTTNGLSLFSSSVGIHVFAWLKILLEAGLGIACFSYEIYFLKHKLNLK